MRTLCPRLFLTELKNSRGGFRGFAIQMQSRWNKCVCEGMCVSLGKDAGVGRGWTKPSLLGATVHYLVWPWGGTEDQKSVQRTPEVAGSPSTPLPSGPTLCSLVVSTGHFSCNCYPGSRLCLRHISLSPLLLDLNLEIISLLALSSSLVLRRVSDLTFMNS